MDPVSTGIALSTLYFIIAGAVWRALPERWKNNGDPGEVFAPIFWPIFLSLVVGVGAVSLGIRIGRWTVSPEFPRAKLLKPGAWISGMLHATGVAVCVACTVVSAWATVWWVLGGGR